MIDESNLLNFYCSGIYDSSKSLTQTEIIMKVLEKLNLVILNFNNLESQTLNNIKTLDKQVNYYLDTGLKIELGKKLDEMVNDGTFSSIINQQLFSELNSQILENNDNVSALESKVDTNKRETDEIISNNKQLFDNFKNSVEEFIQAYNEYKQTLDTTISDVQKIKEVNTTVNNVDDLRAALLKGGVIYIEPGIYDIPHDNPLLYTSYTTVIGKGEVILRLDLRADGYIMVRPKLSGLEGGYSICNVTFENIIFDGQNSGKQVGLFATCHSKYIKLNKCVFRNLNSSWHLIEINSSYDVELNSCVVSGYNYGVDDTKHRTEAVQLDFAGSYSQYPFDCLYDNTKCENIKFNSCKFERITTKVTGAIGTHTVTKEYMPDGVIIYNCSFYDVDICIYAPDFTNLICDKNKAVNVATFLVLYPSDNTGRCNCNVTNNYFDGKNRSKTISSMNGTPEGRFIFQLNYQYYLNNSEIIGNKVFNAYSYGIGITPNGTTVIGNTIRACGKHGIYIYGGNRSLVNGNVAQNNGNLDSANFHDIYVSIGGVGSVIDCVLTGNSAKVYTDGNSYTNTIIANNLG